MPYWPLYYFQDRDGDRLEAGTSSELVSAKERHEAYVKVTTVGGTKTWQSTVVLNRTQLGDLIEALKLIHKDLDGR